MTVELMFYILIGLGGLILILLLVLLFRRNPVSASLQKLEELSGEIRQTEQNLRQEFRTNREELQVALQSNRGEWQNGIERMLQQNSLFEKSLLQLIDKEMAQSRDENHRASQEEREWLSARWREFAQDLKNRFEEFAHLQRQQAQAFAEKQEAMGKSFDSSLLKIFELVRGENKSSRISVQEALANFEKSFIQNVEAFKALQKEKFQQLEEKQGQLITGTEKKLEEMRVTVDEKLQKTLSERIGQSFEIVGRQLESVQKGLGEMQSIANDVGGLKKVLSNVKLRGGVGEVQLAMLLEQILSPSQYEANVRTKRSSSDRVEFAIRLPGKSDESGTVYLPIDAKFPKDAYDHLINAYENAVPDDIDAASKNLEMTIRKMARDIREKYIDPPYTTDFAILFLPFENLYAEVIRRTPLIDQLRQEYNITVAGPTTLTALLNSLQMGFRTLAIQKRSSEVWEVLAKVKKEFENFGGMLEKAQKNIQTGLGQLDNVVGPRTRAIQRSLRKAENLPAVENPGATLVLPGTEEDKSAENEE